MGHGAAGISCRGIAERFLGFFVRERMQQRHAARERFLCSGGARHRKLDGSERSLRSVGPMLLLAQDFAIERQQQAEGPEQCDCAFACFSHVKTPDGFSFAVDGSALGPEGQSSSGSLHSFYRFASINEMAHSGAETLWAKRARSRLFACVCSGGVAWPVSSAAA